MMWFYLFMVNAVPVACLTLLSIHFDKWWIVLFALLFSVSYKSSKNEENGDEIDDDYDECE